MFNNGDIVYFMDRDNKPWFGVFDCYTDDGRAYVDFLERVEDRCINGVPIDEFVSETEWKKLPKDWTYDMKLFDLTYKSPIDTNILKTLRIDHPEDIRKAIEIGLLVKASMKYHGIVEAEVDRHKGYRIVKKIPHWTQTYGNPPRDYDRFYIKEIFASYEEAQKYMAKKKAEREAEAALTDEEWSLKEMDIVLKLSHNPKANEYKEVLSKLPDVWDVDLKNIGQKVLYRYFSKKTEWVDVETLLPV